MVVKITLPATKGRMLEMVNGDQQNIYPKLPLMAQETHTIFKFQTQIYSNKQPQKYDKSNDTNPNLPKFENSQL